MNHTEVMPLSGAPDFIQERMVAGTNPMSHPVIAPNKIGSYMLRNTIGSGGFSLVKVAVHESTGSICACKIVPKKRLLNNQMEKRFENEIRILQKFQHPGIAILYDLFKDTLNYYIMLELCTDGTLLEYIMQRKKIQEDEAKYIFKQIIETLVYVHKNGIAHRDIKPENIMIDSDKNIKFIDFGFSAFVEQDHLFSTKCGTPNYAAPELISGKPYDGFKADIWSCGVVLYSMVFGQLPWTKVNQHQLLDQIVRAEYFIPMSISQECSDLISKMMNPDTEKRIKMEDVLNHPWLRGVKSAQADICQSQSSNCVTMEQVDDFFESPSNSNFSNVHKSMTNFCTTELGKIDEGKSLLALVKRKSFSTRKFLSPIVVHPQIQCSAPNNRRMSQIPTQIILRSTPSST